MNILEWLKNNGKKVIITVFWVIVIILLFKASGIKVFTDDYDRTHIILPAVPED